MEVASAHCHMTAVRAECKDVFGRFFARDERRAKGERLFPSRGIEEVESLAKVAVDDILAVCGYRNRSIEISPPPLVSGIHVPANHDRARHGNNELTVRRHGNFVAIGPRNSTGEYTRLVEL